jgi:hypothetical protein
VRNSFYKLENYSRFEFGNRRYIRQEFKRGIMLGKQGCYIELPGS